MKILLFHTLGMIFYYLFKLWGYNMMRFFQVNSTKSMLTHIGAESLKIPYHIVTLEFSEDVKDHANK